MTHWLGQWDRLGVFVRQSPFTSRCICIVSLCLTWLCVFVAKPCIVSKAELQSWVNGPEQKDWMTPTWPRHSLCVCMCMRVADVIWFCALWMCVCVSLWVHTQKRQSDRGQSTCFVGLCFCETTMEKENNKCTQWGFFNAHKRNKCFKHIRVDKDEVENSQKTRGTSSWTNILCYCVTLPNVKKNCCCLPFSSNNFHLNTDGKSICMISYLIAVKCSRC